MPPSTQCVTLLVPIRTTDVTALVSETVIVKGSPFTRSVEDRVDGPGSRNTESAYVALDLARRALSGLSSADRLLLWLIFGERYSYAEVARRLGKSVGAVKVRAHRCRRQVRERFKEM